jgi:hypothetical protein
MRVELKPQQQTTGAILYNVFENGYRRAIGRLEFFPGQESDAAYYVAYRQYPTADPCVNHTRFLGTFTGRTARADALRAIRDRLTLEAQPVNPGLPSDADGLPS